jgi:glucokinase
VSSVIGIDLGGSHVTAAIVDARGHIIDRSERPIDRNRPADEILRQDVAGAVRDVVERAHLRLDDIAAIGMGLPGNIDRQHGVCRFSPNFHWHNVNVAGPLSQELGKPVYLINDVRSHTLGELHFGAGRGHRSFAMLALGTGIGGGLVINNMLVEGAHSAGGELGHITVDPHGPQCNCGNHGCIETLASAPALARMAQEAVQAGQGQAITAAAQRQGGKLDAAALQQAARAGDPAAKAIYDRAGRALGVAMADVYTSFDPEVILIGGGVAKAGELLLEPARDELRQRCHMIEPELLKVEPAGLGTDAGVLGAAALALESVGELPAAAARA